MIYPFVTLLCPTPAPLHLDRTRGTHPRDESTFALSFPWYLLFPCFPVLSMNLSKRHGNRGQRPLPKRDCKDTPFFHSTKTFFNFFMIFSNFFSRKHIIRTDQQDINKSKSTVKGILKNFQQLLPPASKKHA